MTLPLDHPLLNGYIPQVVADCHTRPCRVAARKGDDTSWQEWGHGEGRPKADQPGANVRAIAVAKAWCNNCPVLEACREWACATPDPVPHMVAGGLTTQERAAARQNCCVGGPAGYAEHLRRGEPPCTNSRIARAARYRQLREERRGA